MRRGQWARDGSRTGLFFPYAQDLFQVESEELTEPGIAYRLTVGSLNDIEIRGAIALDQLRPVRRQGDVPADYDSVGECGMGTLD